MAKSDRVYENLENQLRKIRKHNRQGSFKTRQRYHEANQRFCRFLAERYQSKKFSNIQDKHLEAYVEDMKARGLSPSTIKTDLGAIRFYHDKVDNPRYKLSDNTAFNIDKRQFGGVDRTWSKEQYEGMIDTAKRLDQGDIAHVIQIARYQGLRIHEVMRLDRNTAEKALNTGVLTIKGKGGKVRSVPLSIEGAAVLENVIQDKDRGEKLFVESGRKTHLEIKRVQSFIGRHRGKFKDERDNNITYHGLRHAWAQERYQEAKERGLSDYQARKEVSKLLGHERDEVTRIYLHKSS